MKSKLSEKDIDIRLKDIVVLVDSREKVWSHIKLWFKSNKINYIEHKLDYGDYSFMLKKNEKLGITEDIYFDKEVCIERKANAEELSNNYTVARDRFRREHEKSNGALRLLIEASDYGRICDGDYGTDFNPDSYIGSLHSFQEKYNTPFFFCDKQHSAKYIYNTFKYYLRNKLINS